MPTEILWWTMAANMRSYHYKAASRQMKTLLIISVRENL